jgi:ketosteroid isomerase-like protein
MRTARVGLLLACLVLGACATTARDIPALEAEVASTEAAFAKTMADRDFAAFQRFLAPDAVFFSGPEALRGQATIAAYWHRFFEAAAAPFAWQPDQVRVLASGELALSSGPVRDLTGQPLGRFNSIWRRTSSGRWQIVFDKGEDLCRCAATP